MSNLIYNKYSDCQIFNDIKVYLQNIENKICHYRSNDKVIACLNQCESIQMQLDIVKFRLILADHDAQVFKDYVQNSEIDNSDHYALKKNQIKIILHLSPKILDDFGMDGINEIVKNDCNDSFDISLNLPLPYSSLEHVDLNMYEKVSEHECDVRKQFYDPNLIRISPDDLPI